MAKKVNPQGMKTSQFSQLKKPPVTEENVIFFSLIRRKVGSSQECYKDIFSSISPSSGLLPM